MFPRLPRAAFILHPSSFILLLTLLPLSGCAAAGVLAYKVAGPPPVEAKFTPRQAAMLVLVENFRNASSAQAHSELLAAYLAEELTANKVAPLVPPEKLRELQDARPGDYSRMSITAVGRAVGAEQILYVQLQRSDVIPLQGGDALQGQAHAVVKLIDAATGDTLWPTDVSDGHAVSAGTSLGTQGGTDPMDVRQRMYRSLAVQIDRLFHKWKPDDMAPDPMR
ncbi:MAG TPA: hypothetical protein VER17_20980 [Tepidisphaeraceae bacterium]|nr:hypothetical protein [Tepidisphaeraceae bacterium]